MLGSYYAANYYRNPVPYTSSDIGAPVPGWGANLKIAGPTRVGVSGSFGQEISPEAYLPGARAVQQIRTDIALPSAPRGEESTAEVGKVAGLPWWAWPALAAVGLGALGYYGTKKGWF